MTSFERAWRVWFVLSRIAYVIARMALRRAEFFILRFYLETLMLTMPKHEKERKRARALLKETGGGDD